jgi:F0F1-type ATP synthase membrane subunit a
VLVPLFRAPNADLNMTLGLALVTFTTVQILGIRAHGVGGRIKHMATRHSSSRSSWSRVRAHHLAVRPPLR